MALPDRFRDRGALAEAVVFGLVGAAAGLCGPVPWAVVAGILTAVVVLVFATRQDGRPADPDDPGPEEPAREAELVERVRKWASEVVDTDLRSRAESVVVLAEEVERLALSCELRNQRIESPEGRAAAGGRLSTIRSYVDGAVDGFGSAGPGQAYQWDGVAHRLTTAVELLRRELGEQVQHRG